MLRIAMAEYAGMDKVVAEQVELSRLRASRGRLRMERESLKKFRRWWHCTTWRPSLPVAPGRTRSHGKANHHCRQFGESGEWESGASGRRPPDFRTLSCGATYLTRMSFLTIFTPSMSLATLPA